MSLVIIKVMESTKKTLKKADTLTVEDAAKQVAVDSGVDEEVMIPVTGGSTGESGMDDEHDDELASYQKSRKTPMFRLSSVNVDEEEQVLMEVQDFSSISDAKTAG